MLIHEYINFIKDLKLSRQNKTLLTHVHFFKYSEIVKRFNLSYQVMNHYLNAFQKFSPLAHKKTKARYKRIFKNESKKNVVENN
ncbi:hypothetical protein UREOM_6680 [Ureaplasma sp. OM1]|uniref:Uncharacterized protein n=1 Tax=Ureaplasma ceti TaxID=3119530 RepID=A0ABP9U9U3_9BACT